jgi:sulfide dehydrogenase cytochrome subunit
MKRLIPQAVLVLFAFSLAPAYSADVASLEKDCNDCHGPHGISESNDVPTIAGTSTGILGDYLTAYREKDRPCPKSKYRHGDTKRPETDMCAVTAKLSDADIGALAARYAAKPFKAAKQAFDPAKAAAGKKLHARDCEKCHTGSGRDADADAAILAGQWSPYLKQAMDHFVSGERPMPKKMKEKVSKLAPADIDALVNFYASLQ